MNTHLLEVSDGYMHGKFMLARLDADDLRQRSALPGYETDNFWTNSGGRRKFNTHSTLVIDCQTGAAVALSLDPYSWTKLERDGEHAGAWVCPMFRPMLKWLCQQGIDKSGDLTGLPRFVEIDPMSGDAKPRVESEAQAA